jgi:hypothetical protein
MEHKASKFKMHMKDLNNDQLTKVFNHFEIIKTVASYNDCFSEEITSSDKWCVVLENDVLIGYSFTKKIDMPKFLQKIGIDMEKVKVF